MTATPARSDGRVLLPIRTKLGNIVNRWVLPDNPNVVREQVQPAVAVTPVAPEVVVPVTPTIPKSFDIYAGSTCSCCGAAYWRATPPAGPEVVWDDERIQRAYDVSGEKVNMAYYLSQAKAYEGHHKNYPTEGYDRQVETYRRRAEECSFEVYKAQKKYLGTTRISRTKNANLTTYGVAICDSPFNDFTVCTPGGMYLKKTYEPVNTAEDTIDAFETPKFTPAQLGRDAGISTWGAGGAYPFPDDESVYLLGGMSASVNAGPYMLAGCRKAGVKPGTRALAIFNQTQRNSNRGTIDSIAAAGFTEVLRTGNSNHPGHSTLYIYERVIQEGDYDALKS